MTQVRPYARIRILQHTPLQHALDSTDNDVRRASVKRVMVALDARIPEDSAQDRADFERNEIKYSRMAALVRYLKIVGPDGHTGWSSHEDES